MPVRQIVSMQEDLPSSSFDVRTFDRIDVAARYNASFGDVSRRRQLFLRGFLDSVCHFKMCCGSLQEMRNRMQVKSLFGGRRIFM